MIESPDPNCPVCKGTGVETIHALGEVVRRPCPRCREAVLVFAAYLNKAMR